MPASRRLHRTGREDAMGRRYSDAFVLLWARVRMGRHYGSAFVRAGIQAVKEVACRICREMYAVMVEPWRTSEYLPFVCARCKRKRALGNKNPHAS